MTLQKKTRVLLLLVPLLVLGGVYLSSSSAPDSPPDQAPSLPAAGVPEDVSQLPPQVPVGSVIKESGTGKEYISNQVIVEFIPIVSEADALGIITKYEGTVFAHTTKAPLYLIVVPDSKDGSVARRIRDDLRKEGLVKRSELNYLELRGDSPAP